MREVLHTRAGWYLLFALILFAPLIQGGSPRFPTMVVQCSILLLGALWMYEWGWNAPCQSLRITLLDCLLALFLFLALFSFLFAPYQHGAQRGLLLILCYCILYWWLVFHQSLKGLRIAFLAAAGQGVFQAALVWYQWLGETMPRPSGTFHNMNFMAGLLAVCAVLAAGKVLFPGSPVRRTLPALTAWSAAGILMVSALLISGSRGGMLAFAVGLAVLLWLRRPALAVGGVSAGLAGLFLVPNPWVARLTNLAEVDVYAYSRLSIWKSALQMMGDHPWFGVGLGQFEYFSHRYAFPVEVHWARYGRVAKNAHNEYLQVGAEMGTAALLLVGAAVILFALWSLKAAGEKRGDSREGLVPLVAALAALLAHAAVDFVFHVPPLALLLVFLAAGARLHGAAGPSWLVEFRFRRGYSLCLLAFAALLFVSAVRPVVGFWYFLAGVGSPQSLLREKWALEEAPKRELPHARAIVFLERAVKEDPRNSAYHNLLGSRYFRMSAERENSQELIRKGLYHANFASELNPNNHLYAKSLGEAMESLYSLTGDKALLAKAEESYRRVLALTPRSYVIHEKLGFMEEALGRFGDAEKFFREVVELEPAYLRGWYNLGIFLARRGRVAEAREAMSRGAEAASVKRSVNTAYERKLVDFDGEMFDNWLRENGEETSANFLK